MAVAQARYLSVQGLAGSAQACGDMSIQFCHICDYLRSFHQDEILIFKLFQGLDRFQGRQSVFAAAIVFPRQALYSYFLPFESGE